MPLPQLTSTARKACSRVLQAQPYLNYRAHHQTTARLARTQPRPGWIEPLSVYAVFVSGSDAQVSDHRSRGNLSRFQNGFCRIDRLSSMRRQVASASKSAVRQSFITDDFRSRLINYRAGPDGLTTPVFEMAQAFELAGKVNLRMSYRVVSSVAQLRPSTSARRPLNASATPGAGLGSLGKISTIYRAFANLLPKPNCVAASMTWTCQYAAFGDRAL